MKKKWMVKGGVLTLVFILSLMGFDYYYAEKKNEGASEMLGATLPVLGIRIGEYEINTMHGYLGDIDERLLRETVTPVDATGKINLELMDYDYDITAIYYQIVYGGDSTTLEEGVLNQLEENQDQDLKLAALSLKSSLDSGREYLARFTIRLDSSRKVNYYTRLKYGTDLHFEESVEFAETLSDMMLEKDDGLNLYLEPDEDVISNSLASVDIHSSFEAVTYAQSKPERMGEAAVAVKEINEDYLVIELRFPLQIQNGKEQTTSCGVVENYKVRYSPNRMFLLDYDRSQEAYYNPDYVDAANNRLYLGIGTNENVTFLSSEDNEKVCFVRERQLWYYNYQAASVTRVFSFLGEDLSDWRAGYSQHDIHILKMDEKGNINFIVYGYMNRGRHEGENGIALYHFNAKSCTNEELAFIPSKLPFQKLQEDVEKFSYMNTKEVVFFLLDGTLYQADTGTGKWEILRDNLVDNSLTASSDHGIIAVQEQEDSSENTQITLIDLETGQESAIRCSQEERIQSVGFILTDFIYGVAEASKVGAAKNGTLEFPMYELKITDEAGKEIKKYNKSGQYIIDAQVDGNVIQLVYGKETGSSYKQTGSDYIRYKNEEEEEISVVFGYDTVCYNQLYLQFPLYVYVQTAPVLKLTKELVSDEMEVINVEEQEMSAVQYLVYGNGTLADTCDTVYDAVQEAEEIRGMVVDNGQQTIWESNIPEYNQVIGLNMEKVSNQRDTFAACVSMIAALEGEKDSLEEIKEAGEDKLAVLGEYVGGGALNLYGCSVDQVLYYVGRGVPVIANLSDGHYVLVMSYNSTKVRYMDPLSGEEAVPERADFQKEMKKSGNEFYSYIK